jgi:acyl-CoA thioester hydrolase
MIDDATRAAHGVDGDWPWALGQDVRWCDCDLFGHANHTAYLAWFEDLRSVFLEADGLPRLTMDTPGPVIAQLDIRYVAPLAYRDRVLVTGRTVEVRRTSFTMDYAVWRDRLVARSRQVIVLMVNRTGERVALPPALRDLWIGRHGAVDAGGTT